MILGADHGLREKRSVLEKQLEHLNLLDTHKDGLM